MARKKYAKAKKRGSTSSMYPALHPDVLNAISSHIGHIQFNRNDSDDEVEKSYSTFVMGKFICHNQSCAAHAWSSGKITILIRRYQNGSYNAVVFKQRCKMCNALGKLKMDKDSYVDRVSYRLLKWAGVALAQPTHGTKKCPPHRADLCEGCKHGICKEQDG